MSEQSPSTEFIEVHHHALDRTMREEPLTAIMLFLQGKVTIERFPEIVCEDEEKTHAYREIISGIYKLKDDTPSGHFVGQLERLNTMHLKLLGFLKDEYFAKDENASTYQKDIIDAFLAKYPSEGYSYSTVERGLRAVRAKGHLQSHKGGHYTLRKFS